MSINHSLYSIGPCFLAEIEDGAGMMHLDGYHEIFKP